MQTRQFFLKSSLALCGLLVLAHAALADNWPRFRGPNGTGIAKNQNIPVQWEKENILWKLAVPGMGNSSPIIWDDHLFLQSSAPDGSQRMLLCYHSKTSKLLWSKTMPGHKVPPSAKPITHVKNTFASSSPATDGERVYTCFWNGKEIQLVAYDFSGNEIWTRNLGAFTSQHGAGASPIIYENKLFFLNDQDGKASLLALNCKTGDILWEVPRPFERACYGTPFLWEKANGSKELVVVTTHEFTGYNPETGKENWHWTWKHSTKFPLRVTGSPIFVGNMIFGCSGDGGGDRYMVAVEVNGNGKEAQPKMAWSKTKVFPYVPSLLSHGDHLYFVNDAGMAGCFEAKTGKEIWFERLSEAAFCTSPVIIDGKIYAVDEVGDVYVLPAAPKFEVLARNALDQLVRASPAVANQRLYIRGKTHLFCIGQVK